jgi:hypothetical protein
MAANLGLLATMAGKNDWRQRINFKTLTILIAFTVIVFALSVWMFRSWTGLPWNYRIAWIASVFADVGGVIAFLYDLIIKKKPDDNKITIEDRSVKADVVNNSLVVTGGQVQLTIQLPETTYSSLHQLPPPPADFTGREGELNELLNAVEKDGVVISGLHGMGGVGKTALALKLGEALKPKYPDAQIYMDLKGTTDKPLTPADIMSHVVRSYRPEVKLPETEAELLGLYYSLLEGQKTLLLLDNAVDAIQVEPLLPPRICLLLVTSRQRFTLPGLQAVNLDVLSRDEADEFVLKIAP